MRLRLSESTVGRFRVVQADTPVCSNQFLAGALPYLGAKRKGKTSFEQVQNCQMLETAARRSGRFMEGYGNGRLIGLATAGLRPATKELV